MEIYLTDVVKQYPGSPTCAIEGLTLTIEGGKVTTLLGPSGCGKTTTLRCIAGFEGINGGTLRFGETVVSDAGRIIVEPSKRNFGMVFQSYALWPHMTVMQNIAYGLRARNWDKARIAGRVDKMLKMLELSHLGKRYPGELSGGQQQRVALGRALAYDPSVLLLDEPLANLDARLRDQMREEIRALYEQTGVTMVYVTHDQSEAAFLSDNVVVMNAGKIQQNSPPAELFDHPANSFVARFVSRSSVVPASEVRRIDGRLRVKTALGECDLCSDIPVDAESSLLVSPSAIDVLPRGTSAAAVTNKAALITDGEIVRIEQGDIAAICMVKVNDVHLKAHLPLESRFSRRMPVTLAIDPAKCQLIPGC
ncbi:MAG: ABC transporter ATP-binding protein [Hyphomicrobiales bacterium]|nr:ABC transporter ATP-binding protein [Hyphomicrobiales bacterium]